MRRLSLAVLLLVACRMPSAAAGKVANDPNARITAPPAVTTRQVDQRLAQKVTYASGEVRLHDVADYLTTKTGVKIKAGSSVQDWRVRDIPLVVAVKDLPLDRLLRAIAESTHTSLATERITRPGKPDEFTYRFYRSRKDDINEQLRKAHEQQLEDAGWAWDAAVTLGQHPEVTLREELQPFRLVGQLLATLGPDAKGKALAGETVRIDSNVTNRELFRKLQTTSAAIYARPKQPDKEVTEEMVDSSALIIKLVDAGDTGRADIYASLTPGFYPAGLRTQTWLAELEKKKDLKLPPRPYNELQIGVSDPPPGPGLEMLKWAVDPPIEPIPGKDWTEPELIKEVTLPLPKKSFPVYADQIMAIAEATGYNIVVEDFHSYRCSPWDNSFKDEFEHKAKACELLNKNGVSWFLDKNSKLLVGWDGLAGYWRTHHANLVPESLVDRLVAKTEDAVELDDITFAASLTGGQRGEWFVENNKTWWMAYFSANIPLWSFYDSLTPEEKQFAKSETGLVTSAMDVSALGRFIREALEAEARAAFPDSAGHHIGGESNTEAMRELVDPKVLSTVVVRVKSKPTERPTMLEREQPKGDLADREGFEKWWHSLHTYYMEIEYTLNGKRKTAVFEGPKLSFPLMLQKKFLKEKDTAAAKPN